MKVLKDVDSSLVSNENFSEILPFDGWSQVKYRQPKMAKNLPYLWCHSQKNETQIPNFFSLQTQRLAKSFEGLNSSLAQSAEGLAVGKTTEISLVFLRFPSMIYLYTGSQGVKGVAQKKETF